MNQYGVTMRDIYQARHLLHGRVRRTPLLPSATLGEVTGAQVFLKAENLQPTGTFKVRGATNSILGLTPEQRAAGVIAFSTGNHGRAVAAVAAQEGITAVVCCSERVPAFRIQAMRELGAEVVQHGQSQDEAYAKALELQRDRGLTMIAPFDDAKVIAGQGTVGLEILEDLPGLDTVVVPLSGGGLMSGVALALKTADPDIRVIGVSMEVAPAMYHSLQAGHPVEIPEKDSLADALLGGIGLDNRFTFPLCRDLVDQTILVTEEEIARGMRHLMEVEHLVVEGSGAVGVAAILAGKLTDLGESAALVLSGGNLETGIMRRIIGGGAA